MSRKRVVVIGAGAAGTMAAVFAATAGADTVLLERTRDGGRKILISGGGRCNVLPSELDESRYITDSSVNSMRKMIRSWPHAEQRAFFEHDVGIPLVEETESRKLFPVSNKARDVRDGLLALASRRGAAIHFETTVTDLRPDGNGWDVACNDARHFAADAVVVATGGLSVPATGSDGTGLRLLAKLGHVVHPAYAALTPIVDARGTFAGLAGVSLPVTLTATGSGRSATAKGGFLFTHIGYSGPSALDVSHVLVRSRAEAASESARLSAQWSVGEQEWLARLVGGDARTVANIVRSELPERLVSVLMSHAEVPAHRTPSELTRDERRRLIDVLVRCPLPWTSDEGYKKAEVTGGGVALSEIDARTMQSKRCHGLHICGEALDAFGPIGGYNFLWAWATGRAAGLGASG